MRAVFALVLLLNYLTVVLAGSWTALRQPAPTAARPYVHVAECQQQNYLRLDCFNDCNGDQLLVVKYGSGATDHTDALSPKMLDCHLPAPSGPAVPAPPLAYYQMMRFLLRQAPAIIIIIPVVGPPPEYSLDCTC